MMSVALLSVTMLCSTALLGDPIFGPVAWEPDLSSWPITQWTTPDYNPIVIWREYSQRKLDPKSRQTLSDQLRKKTLLVHKPEDAFRWAVVAVPLANSQDGLRVRQLLQPLRQELRRPEYAKDYWIGTYRLDIEVRGGTGWCAAPFARRVLQGSIDDPFAVYNSISAMSRSRDLGDCQLAAKVAKGWMHRFPHEYRWQAQYALTLESLYMLTRSRATIDELVSLEDKLSTSADVPKVWHQFHTERLKTWQMLRKKQFGSSADQKPTIVASPE